MKLPRFNEFKKFRIVESLEEPMIEESEIEVEGKQFTKLEGKSKSKIDINGVIYKKGMNIKFIFAQGYIIFDIVDMTDEQLELSVIDSTVKTVKFEQTYMVYIKDINKLGDIKLYFDFASENNKWIKKLPLTELMEVDLV